MPYKLQFQDNNSIIEVVYNQETDYNTRLMTLEEVIHYIKPKGKKINLLIDVQNIKTLLTTQQEYEFGVKLSSCKELIGSKEAALKKYKLTKTNS